MRVLLRQVARRQDGGIEYHDRELTADGLAIGRAGDQDVFLPGAAVALRHARLRMRRDGACEVVAVGAGGVSVNGRPVASARVEAGDVIGIGPHRLKRIPAPAGFDLALEIEHGEQNEQAVPAAIREPQLSGWSRRRWSWFLGLAFLGAGLIVPLAGVYVPPVQEWLRATPGLPSDHWWDSGPLIPAHDSHPAGRNCTACHQVPFRLVRNDACGECHESVTRHASTETTLGSELAARRCAACHKEHGGAAAIVRRDGAFCTACHGSLTAALGEQTGLRDVRDFAREHPEFRLTFLRPPSEETGHAWTKARLAIDSAEAREQSGLKYNHKVHLEPEGVDTPEGKKRLGCGDCHRPDPSGVTMRPIGMKEHCSECHTLQFENLSLPHASVEQVIYVLRGYYYGGPVPPATPIRQDVMAEPRRRARRPGEPAQPPARNGTPEERAQRAARNLFDRTLCAVCHTIERFNPGQEPGWRVDPVRLNQDWLPLARFSHKSHRHVECTECHGADTSERAEDVLMPAIKACRECHGAEDARKELAACVQCHRFHQPGQPSLFAADTARDEGGRPLRDQNR